MARQIFRFKAKIWRWPGYAGWHFVTLPKPLSRKIKKTSKTYGSGFVKVKVSVGKSIWTTALFPHKASDSYILSVKKPIRKKEGLYEDDTINISLAI